MKVTTVLLFCAIITLTALPVSSVESSYSASYRSGIFYKRLCNVHRTGDVRTDIVSIAMSQIGYMEGNKNSQLSGCTEGGKNYTEYGSWYGMQDMWCAMFVSWCAAQAGVSEKVFYKHAYTPYGINWFEARNLSYTRQQVASGTYIPQPGDLVYFCTPGVARKVNHVGIVVRYEDGILYSVEGNTNDMPQSTNGGKVCLKSYSIEDTYIRYICSPKY